MERPTQKFMVGREVTSAYHDETGRIEKIEWTYTFGCWTYLLVRTKESRYGGKVGEKVWVCETDLKEVL